MRMYKTIPGMLNIHMGEITEYVKQNQIDAVVRKY